MGKEGPVKEIYRYARKTKLDKAYSLCICTIPLLSRQGAGNEGFINTAAGQTEHMQISGAIWIPWTQELVNELTKLLAIIFEML